MRAAVYPRDGLELPFDSVRLDALMEESELDVLLVTSKHNTRYLLGGHEFFFFPARDAIGISRYLPVLLYARGKPAETVYVGFANEGEQTEVAPLWVPTVSTTATRTDDAIRTALSLAGMDGASAVRMGVEEAFLPVAAYRELGNVLPRATFCDAHLPLERLRARKSPYELSLMRGAAERIVGAMQEAIAAHGPGSTKREIAAAVRLAQVSAGLDFEYCLIAAGPSRNLAPSSAVWHDGEPLSLDCGGNLDGYIGDVARMAVAGDPDAELVELLAQVEAVQAAARARIRAGAIGAELFEAGEQVLREQPMSAHLSFLAHGMGLVNHEAPRLTDTGPLPYPATDAGLPLEEGMVISVETTLVHPRRGFVKLEDTLAVTDPGADPFGDSARGWNPV